MATIYLIIFLLACGNLYLHLHLYSWKSQYRGAAMALNLITPLVYAPILLNLWSRIAYEHDPLSMLIRSWGDTLSLGIGACALALGHWYIAIQTRKVTLPKILVILNWPILLIPLGNFVLMIATERGFFMGYIVKHALNNPSFIDTFFMITVYVPMALMALYLAIFIYICYLIDKQDTVSLNQRIKAAYQWLIRFLRIRVDSHDSR